jgi:uncharacterized protein YdeI (YjbR/CyaY-like superfamily)
MIPTERFAKVEVASLDELRDWLDVHYQQQESVWLVRYKNTVPAKFVDRLALLDELLCYGWIDGLARKLDDERTMQLISPRRQQAWAKSYKDRAASLIAQGRMRPPGLAAIERSKALGQWDATAEIDALVVPPDLQAALDIDPRAARRFAEAAPSYRRNVLRWISAAKTPDTRAKRIGITVDHAASGRKVPQM